MGGVCPCFAGVSKAAEPTKAKEVTETAPAEPKPPTETTPLIAKEAAEPTKAQEVPEKTPAEPNPLMETAPVTAKEAAEPSPPRETTPATAKEAAEPSKAKEVPEKTPAEPNLPTKAGAIPEGLRVGSFLDIYSNSYQAWCHGVVQAMESDAVAVAYQAPVGNSGDSLQIAINTKILALDSQEIRAPLDDGPWLGSIVEVYSHSRGQWLPARIQMITKGVASVVFYYPDAPEGGAAVVKDLPLGDKDLRLPGADPSAQPPAQGQSETPAHVEVFSHSLGQWLPAVIQEITNDQIKVAFYYPDMDAATEEPVCKELPIGTQDVRLPPSSEQVGTIDPNVNPADFVVGKPIEVYSHSRGVWIQAVILEVTEAGMLTASFEYEDMPGELQAKVLPIGHSDLRLSGSAV